MSEQAVTVRFDYGQTDLSRLFELEDRLIAAIEAAGVGMFDGNEVAMDGSDGTLFMYGPDADKLFEVVQPVLASTRAIRNIVATIRYAPNVKERDSHRQLRCLYINEAVGTEEFTQQII